MQTTDDALHRIRTTAAGESRQLRHVEACPPGSGVRQGDVYLVRLASDPVGSRPTTERALAPADARGRRHVVEGDGVLCRPSGGDPHDGWYLHARGRVEIAHPEHASISIPAGWYEVRVQIDYDAIDDTQGPASLPGQLSARSAIDRLRDRRLD